MHFLNSDILDSPGILHGFFTRKGGVSSGVYGSLNCSYGSGDDRDNIAENRRRIAASLGSGVREICTNRQVHGTNVVEVQDSWDASAVPEADALVTDQPGFGLSILTADCVPVLLLDPNARVIAAAHAGWRGALGGVIEAAVSAMERLGAARSEIVAATGPAIQQRSYEVGPEVREAFVQQESEHARFFTPSSKMNHFQFDLPGLVDVKLAAAEICATDLSLADTYEDKENYFSYRRTTHNGEPDYGRTLTVIALED